MRKVHRESEGPVKEQGRFILLVGGIVVVVAGLWLLLGPGPPPPEGPVAPPSTVRDDVDSPTVSSGPVGRRQTPSARRITHGAVGARREVITEVGQIAGTPQSGIGLVKGEVVWADTKAPVAGAEVFAEIRDYHEGEKPPTVSARWRTVADAAGKFQLDKLPEFRAILDADVHYRLYAQTDDAFGEGGFQLTDDEPSAYEKIELYPAGVISGRVIDESGQPVAKAWLSPHRYRVEGSERDTWASSSSNAISNDSGEFAIGDLRPGEWSFVVRSRDYVTTVSDFAPVGSDGLTITLERGSSVSGTVINVADSSPVSNIDVNFSPTDQESHYRYAKAKSGQDGAFAAPHVAAGGYRVYVRDDTYVLVGSPPEITVEAGREVAGLSIPVALGGVVTGRAYDLDTGEPIQNVVIRSRHSSGNEVHTDSDGYYRLEGLPEGTNTIGRKWKEGYLHGEEREDKEVVVRIGEVVTDIDFPMKKGLYIRGKVTDREGNPIEFARVRSSPMNESGEGEGTQTLQDGTFEHRGFSPNTELIIEASKEGFQRAQVGPLKIGESDLEDVKLVLEPGAAVEGEVVDTRGNPMPNVHVNARAEDSGAGGSTDMYGRFTITGLAPGVYSLSMYDYGQSGATSRLEDVQQVTVPTSGTVEGIRLVFKPVKGPAIAGRVVDRKRKPIEGVYINAHGEEDHSSYGNTRSGEDGRFEITGLKPGTHRITAHDQRYTYMDERLVAETGNRNVEIVLSGKGTVEGRVVDDRTGQPIKHFQVWAARGLQSGVAGYNMHGRQQAFYNENGEFSLSNVDEGEATVVVRASGYAPAMQQLANVDEYTPVRGLVFRMEAGGRIEGSVVDEAGEPVNGASITIQDTSPEGQGGTSQAAKTDGRGRFVIEGLSTNFTSLQAYLEGLLPTTVEVHPAAGRTEEVTIRMTRGGIVEGRVTVNGKAAGGLGVEVQNSSQGIYTHVRTDQEGRYSRSGLVGGEYVIRTNPPPGVQNPQNTQQTAIVEEGKTTVVDFAF